MQTCFRHKVKTTPYSANKFWMFVKGNANHKQSELQLIRPNQQTLPKPRPNRPGKSSFSNLPTSAKMTLIPKSALLALALAMISPVEAAYKNVVYYMEWAIYARNFGIFDLDWSKITHVNYAFGKPTADGTVTIYDSWAAVQKRWPEHGDSWNDQGNGLYGNFGQGFKQKLQNRGTKFGLSIGGWTMSDLFSGIASIETSRRTFAKSAVKLMTDLGLDFVDIDWEYPVEGGNDSPPVQHRPDDMANYVLLLKAIRDEFKTLPFKAELSVASPAGPQIYRHWDFTSICGQLDHINIMAYDLAGSWSNYTDHQANLYEDPNHPAGLKYSAHTAVQDYIKGGCPSNKIVLGIQAYGRSFENTAGLYSSFTPPTKGSWVSGSDVLVFGTTRRFPKLVRPSFTTRSLV
ncbi:hypothetical protein AC1031_014781 [Aphanomyces cochlioides]|nr:hypothetical protein AC1031_014781 [Aphanomyces cochlioides]